MKIDAAKAKDLLTALYHGDTVTPDDEEAVLIEAFHTLGYANDTGLTEKGAELLEILSDLRIWTRVSLIAMRDQKPLTLEFITDAHREAEELLNRDNAAA